MAIPLRADFDAQMTRAAAKRSKGAPSFGFGGDL